MSSIDLRYSKDGGHNWSDWHKLDIGAVGNFNNFVEKRRLGQGREWIFDVRITDPICVDIMGMGIMPEQCDS